MTSAVLRLATPTPFERLLQRLAAALTRHVESRIAERAYRKEIALDMLREQQARKSEPMTFERMLVQLGPLRH